MSSLTLEQVVKSIPTPNQSYLDERVKNLTEAVKKLKEKWGGFFGYTFKTLPAEKIEFDRLSRDLKEARFKQKYPHQLDLGFLEQTQELRLEDRRVRIPKFAVVRAYDPDSKMDVEIKYNFEINSNGDLNLPEVIEVPLLRGLRSNGLSYQGYLASYVFSTVLPQEIKAKLKVAKKDFGRRNLFFVAETSPQDWVTRVTRNGDPLLIGTRFDVTYLLGRFDVTSAENYVAREFGK